MDKNNFNNKEYWYNFFESKASNSKYKNSPYANGFLDIKLAIELKKIIRDYLIKNNFGLIYDCGCGDGTLTSSLINKNIKVIGFDMSQKMCELSTSKGIKTHQMDMEKFSSIKLKNYQEDFQIKNSCLLFSECLGYLKRPSQFVLDVCNNNQEIDNILISFPNGFSLIRIFTNLLHSNMIIYFSSKDIIKKIKPLSFKENKLKFVIGIPLLFSFSVNINPKNTFLNSLIRNIILPFALNIVVLYKKQS